MKISRLKTRAATPSFSNDRMGGASGKNYYSACAALCWTDSAQHGRQSYSENARMSGRVDPCRTKKQSFDCFRVMQSEAPAVKIIGHWNYPALTAANYRYEEKRFNGTYWEGTGVWHTRDPHHKTVYVVASYPVAAVELLVNGRRVGRCDQAAKHLCVRLSRCGCDAVRLGRGSRLRL